MVTTPALKPDPQRPWSIPASSRLDLRRQHLHHGAPLGTRRKRGARAQAVGSSRGGQTTKIHALTDLLGRPAMLHPTAGNVSEIEVIDDLLAQGRPIKRLIANKGYDADKLRKTLKAAGTTPIIPGHINRKRSIQNDGPALSRPLARRRRILQAEGLPSRRHPLRQAREELPLRRRPRNHRRNLDLIESGS